MKYHIYITINDNIINYKTDIDDAPYLFKNIFKDGEIRNNCKIIKTSLEKTLNNFLFSYYNKIKNSEMTSDEAIYILKKYKEKLDLELISQEEYNKKKEELSKFIK